MENTTERLVRLTSLRGAAGDGTARSVRQAAGASLAEVAAAAGVTKGTVSKWERGLATPRGDAAVRYGRVLELLARAAS